MNTQIYTPEQNYKVLVHTITYNQAKYITDTLDGVTIGISSSVGASFDSWNIYIEIPYKNIKQEIKR